MPTPNNDALSIDARALPIPAYSACPESERIDPVEWPALSESMSPISRRPTHDSAPADSHPDAAEPATPGESTGSMTMADDFENRMEPDMCLSLGPRIVEGKEETLRRLVATDSASAYLPRNPNASVTAFPGLLPPPPRPLYTSSYLRPGSRFVGKQQSDKQVYKVEVILKSVDIQESFLCGYLRIEGLTKDHPTLTTYFEGEIIGPKYTFQTKHERWGATEKTDMQHWARFPAWLPFANQAKRADFHLKNFMGKENIFMRWKEYFLVPDHHVREIHGASFEGFYYICFNQVKGTVSGIYFHAKSEKFQQLELEFVPDMGGFAAIEFR